MYSRAYQDRDVDKKRKRSEKIVVNAVMNIIEMSVNPSGRQSRRPNDPVYQELLIELLKSVTNTKHRVQHHYKVQIEKIFNSSGFFSMSERSLRKWQLIMQQYLQNNTELWTGLLIAFDSQGGLFVSQSKKMESQSDVFRRLSFLIFSSKKDQINEQLDPLLKKMADSFKAQQKEITFVTSLFLLSRILMIRLGSRKLDEVLKRLWPHLLGEIVQVFDETQKNRQSPQLDSDSPYLFNGVGHEKKKIRGLAFEAIKIVELMSQLNIEEFQMNQWMFCFDGFGIKYQPAGIAEEGDQWNEDRHWRGSNDEAADWMQTATEGKQIFQPYLAKFMCNNSLLGNEEGDRAKTADYADRFVFYNVDDNESLKKETNFNETLPWESSCFIRKEDLEK